MRTFVFSKLFRRTSGVSMILLGGLFGVAGCGDTEGTAAADAVAVLDPSGDYAVTAYAPADTNAAPVSVLYIRASEAEGGFDLAVTDNNGLAYVARSGLPLVAEPDAGNDYTAGALVAEFPVSGSALAGTIRVVAVKAIPKTIQRQTNETGQVVARHGRHTVSSANARYELEGMLGTNALAARAAAKAGTIDW